MGFMFLVASLEIIFKIIFRILLRFLKIFVLIQLSQVALASVIIEERGERREENVKLPRRCKDNARATSEFGRNSQTCHPSRLIFRFVSF